MRSKKDTIAVFAVGIASIAAVAGAYFTAPIRQVEHTTAVDGQEAETLTSAPVTLSEVAVVDSQATPGQPLPVVAQDTVIIPHEHGVRAYSPTGEQLWHYHRPDRQLCMLNSSWGLAVIGFDVGFGCGDVVSLHGDTGEYAATRSANAQSEPITIRSNDRVGIYGPRRVELWRSDMVRTVEYGEVEAPQEANFQPFEECDITSALTRTGNLAVTEKCSDGNTQLHFMEATPEDSREPELISTTALEDGARLVAVGEDSAAVYLPHNELVSFNRQGEEISRENIAAPALDTPIYSPDLPHHMTWFDGQRLYLLSPTDLSIDQVIEDVLGPGINVGNELLLPVEQGIGVYDWISGEQLRVIPLERELEDNSVPLGLSTAGDSLVEFRGNSVAFLR